MTQATIDLPDKVLDVFEPARGAAQYRALYGGRGSGKSQSAAMMAAYWGFCEPLRILCTRELQVSIKDSFHRELKDAIERTPWLAAHYDVGIDYLRGKNGTEFIFRGLRHNTSSIKSLAGIDLTIVEEAEDVPEDSWLALEATVFRQDKSELWAIWNPRSDGSPVDKRFRKDPPADALIAEVNWQDNPFFPSGLNKLRQREQQRLDPATYAHVWEGAYLENSDAQVFSGKFQIAEFEPDRLWDGPYFGMDFGFAQDPTAAIECYIHNERLYIRREAGRIGLELDDTPAFIQDRMPLLPLHTVRADSARPESISYLQRHGIPSIAPVKKWAGSVEDGVAFIKSLDRVIIHPDCPETAREFRLYSYKQDRLSGDIMPKIVDANNHYIDALRYALQPMVGGTSEQIFGVL
jgi:phage terminase large subunit